MTLIMDNATTTTHTPSPPPTPPSPPSQPLLIFSAPPLSAAQIAILTAPPPPFPGPPSSVDLSPLKFLLAIVAIVTVPAMIYAFIFAFRCPSCFRRPDRGSGESSGDIHGGTAAVATVAAVTDLRYQKDAHVKEIGSECSVCLSAFVDGENLRQLSACKHSFHADCIDLWLSNHSNCPICRSNVTGAGGKSRRSSAPARDDDLHQGLPDASALV